MNPFNARFAIFVCCLLAPFLAGSGRGQELTGKSEPAGAMLPSNSELVELVRRSQDLATRVQDEMRRSREQSEVLQKMLEQTNKELAELRQEVNRLRSAVTGQSSNLTSAATPDSAAAMAVQTSTPSASSAALASRVDRLEDQVNVAHAQIKEQAQTKVESDSRLKVRLYGLVLSNTYVNTAASADESVPTSAPPTSAPGPPAGANLGATLRQTNFGFAMTGPRVDQARLSANVDFDFYGGSAEGYGNSLGVLRMRTASARLEGPRTSLTVGLLGPMISPLNPASLASVYYPALGDSGNLWQWRPQIVAGRREPLDEKDDLILQGGLMMPFGETVNGWSLGGTPGYETRIAFARRLDAERRLEIGAGGYFYRQDLGFERTVNSYAATTDWLIPLSRALELSGEAYYGQAISLSERSGGNIADVFALSGPVNNPSTSVRGVHSAGGWTQLTARASSRLEFNFALGVDDRRNSDIFAGIFDNSTELRNQTYSVNSIYRLRSNFLLSLEYRHLRTTYPDAITTNNHINLAVGYAF
jgi:hypothetical protein